MVALYIAQKMQPIRILNVLPLNFETGLNVRGLKKNDF